MTEQFHWKSPSGVEIVLPHMDKVKAGIIRRYRKSDPVDFIFSLLEEVADEDMLAKVDDLGVSELNDLAEAWQDGASLGESSGSST